MLDLESPLLGGIAYGLIVLAYLTVLYQAGVKAPVEWRWSISHGTSPLNDDC